MQSRSRSRSINFREAHFDNRGLLIGNGIINHRGNVRFKDNLGDIQIQKIIAKSVTAGPGTNLLVRENVFSGGEISLKGSLESEESVVATHGIFIEGNLKAWEEVKGSSINVSKNLTSFGSVFSKHEIIVNGDVLISEGLYCGSNIKIKGKSSIGGDIRAMGSFKSSSHVKCLGKITAKDISIKGDMIAKLGVEILEKAKVFGNMKVSGNIIIPVKLEVHGDLEHIGLIQCPVVVVHGDIYIIQ